MVPEEKTEPFDGRSVLEYSEGECKGVPIYKWNRISCIRVVILSALCLALGGFSVGQAQADLDNPSIAVRRVSPISLRLNRTACATAQIVGHPASSDLTAILSL